MLSASGFADNPCAPELDLSAIATQEVQAGQTLTLNLPAIGGVLTDDETAASDLRWLMDPDAEDFPAGASLTTAGVFSWDTTGVALGNYEFVVIGIDRGTPALADAEVLTVTVVAEPSNTAPTIRLDPPVSDDFDSAAFVEDGGPVSIVGSGLQVSDSDTRNLGPVTIRLAESPDGADESLDVNASYVGFNLDKEYDPDTRTLTVSGEASPAIYQGILRTLTYNNTSQNPTEGTREVTVSISDGTASSEVRTSTFSVTAVPDAPIIHPIDPQNVVVNTTLTVPVSAEDVDGDPIVLTLEDNSEHPGAALVDNGDGTGTITWTPTTTTFPDTVSFRVLANGGAAAPVGASQTFDVTVHEVNLPPQLASIANTPIAAGEALSVNVAATDPNTGQTLTFELDPDNQPEGAVLVNNGNGSATITWQTDDADVGQARFGVLVTDNGFEPLGDSEDFFVTVQPS